MPPSHTEFPVTFADIESARARLDGVINRTPLLRFHALDDRVGGTVWLKAEQLQRKGSFKIRGAYNAIAALSKEARRRGVIAWSSGNHAQGVALAARLFGVRATIVMPDDAPRAKTAAVRALGATIVAYDRYREDREAIAHRLVAETGAALVPSYDHPDVIAGQGTVGLEIVEDLIHIGESPDQALICCGGGGLAAGSALALKQRWPNLPVIGVEPAQADDTRRSLEAGERLSNPADATSICDALLTPTPGALTFPMNRQLMQAVATVTDDEVRYAVGFAFRRLRLVVEPGGAVALAALLSGAWPAQSRKTVIALSGGNIDDERLAECIAAFDRRDQKDSV